MGKWSWAKLKELLIPINNAIEGILILCMSSCKGFSACRMAMQIEDKKYPFFGMVGHNGLPSWPETAIAYATFYHQFNMGKTVKEAVNAMKSSSCNDGFMLITAEQARNLFVTEFSKIDLKDFKKLVNKQNY